MKNVSFAAMLIFIVGCTNLTEYDMASKAGLYIISSENFSTIKTITDIAGGRSLMIHSSNVFLASTEGTIYRYDLESMELVEKYNIAAPSPAGFSQMVYSPRENTAYIIGAMGKILEIGIPDCTVLDEFIVCQAPTNIAIGFGSRYLLVSDGPSNTIYQVEIRDNKTVRDASVLFTVNCMESCQDPNYMLVGTSDGITLVGPSDLRCIRLIDGIQFVAFAAVLDDTVFVCIENHCMGMFNVLPIIEQIPPPSRYFGKVSVGGEFCKVAMGQDQQHAYVLSYMGDNTSRLVAYNHRLHTISQEIDIAGFPLDLKVSKDGNIYVLTTE